MLADAELFTESMIPKAFLIPSMTVDPIDPFEEWPPSSLPSAPCELCRCKLRLIAFSWLFLILKLVNS